MNMNRNTTKVSKGFTLIELLVVISIVALLLAILGPSLSKTRELVEDTICKSNLKQWAIIYSLYTQDNEGSFPQGYAGNNVTMQNAWLLGALLPYYEDLGLRDCPSTVPSGRPPIRGVELPGGTFKQWGPFGKSNAGMWYDSYAEGSYGFSNWIADPPYTDPEESDGIRKQFWGLPVGKAVRNTFVQGSYMIPLICDSMFVDIAPEMGDVAPSNEQNEAHETDCKGPLCPKSDINWNENAMHYMCTDRHKGGINAAFVDMDARHVDVKELWRLKWHNEWEMCDPSNAWPPWMDGYKDPPPLP
jgi:prepilin-type N-terminal cleavage/methylation domain-containing protein